MSLCDVLKRRAKVRLFQADGDDRVPPVSAYEIHVEVSYDVLEWDRGVFGEVRTSEETGFLGTRRQKQERAFGASPWLAERLGQLEQAGHS
jgi:hypothetical protein